MDLLKPVKSGEIELLAHPHECPSFLSVLVDLVHCLLLTFVDLKPEQFLASAKLELTVVDERSLGKPHLG